jgi:hypothetical protein
VLRSPVDRTGREPAVRVPRRSGITGGMPSIPICAEVRVRKGLVVLGLAAVMAFVWSTAAVAAPTAIGAEKCKMCHKVQFDSWAKSKHATNEPKVDCEACHGPGSDYKAMSVMKDPAKAKAAGLIAKPPATMCTEKCHKTKWSDDFMAKAHEHKAKAK